MKATIIDLNHGRDFYIFEREDGEIGYFELLDGPDLEIDDELTGDFSDVGKKTIQYNTNKYTVFIEEFCSIDIAREKIL